MSHICTKEKPDTRLARGGAGSCLALQGLPAGKLGAACRHCHINVTQWTVKTEGWLALPEVWESSHKRRLLHWLSKNEFGGWGWGTDEDICLPALKFLRIFSGSHSPSSKSSPDFLSRPAWHLLTPDTRAPPVAHKNTTPGILASGTTAEKSPGFSVFPGHTTYRHWQGYKGPFLSKAPITPTCLSSQLSKSTA